MRRRSHGTCDIAVLSVTKGLCWRCLKGIQHVRKQTVISKSKATKSKYIVPHLSSWPSNMFSHKLFAVSTAQWLCNKPKCPIQCCQRLVWQFMKYNLEKSLIYTSAPSASHCTSSVSAIASGFLNVDCRQSHSLKQLIFPFPPSQNTHTHKQISLLAAYLTNAISTWQILCT